MAEHKQPTPVKTAEPEIQWMDRLSDMFTRFRRFGWDAVGVLLITLALLTVLALTGLTGGSWMKAWGGFWLRWMGWGAFLVVLLFLWSGVRVLRRSSHPANERVFSLGRILAWECAFFSLLALLSTLGGDSLTRADSGLDGGRIGWGISAILANQLPIAVRAVIFGVIFLIFIALGLNLPGRINRWAEHILGEDVTAEALPPEPPYEEEEAIPSAPKSDRKPAKKPAPLPEEFRKSFKVEPREEEQPLAPKTRDPRLPPLNLLIGEQTARPDERHINLTAGLIEKTLSEFGVPARVVGFRIGPTVTQFAVEPGFIEKPGADGEMMHQKVRVSQISALQRDLALALSAERLRIEAPVPGRSYVGIEVPNIRSSVVRLRPILEAEAFQKIQSPLAIALGRDVSGQPVAADLARMPHLLIAGTTGSGKSVCIAALVTCLVANNTPDDLRLAMIDPKMVELVRFNGLPHLLGKVETDLDRILGVLKWALVEMDHRYRLLEQAKARDLDNYNRKMERRKQPTLPRIVVLIDELADLMMSAPDQTEHSLVRLAQMARAVGIHLVVATQRPSTDVVTGLIKANFPARISFTVASSVDSRVILDTTGAETLLGRGDMLFLNPEVGNPQRAQGVMVADHEIEHVIEFWQKMIPPAPGTPAAPWEQLLNESDDGSDELIQKAIAVVRGSQRASASLLQRRLRIGYPRAARLIDELEELGVVGPSQGGGRDRDVLIGPDEDDEDGDLIAEDEA